MKNNRITFLGLSIVLFIFSSCDKNETASEILQMTIKTIDTIETIYYKQDMSRTNPRDIHNTLYGMQYEFKYFLKNTDSYSIDRLNDSIIVSRDCYQILVRLENKMSMPGFAIELENDEGSISEITYFIDKQTYYPISNKGESFSVENPNQKIIISQRYYDIEFNIPMDDSFLFNTSSASFAGFEIVEMKLG